MAYYMGKQVRDSRKLLTRKTYFLKGKYRLNIGAAGRVVLYPRLGIAFNRVKKNANSSSTSFLHFLEYGSVARQLDVKSKKNSLAGADAPRAKMAARMEDWVIVRDPYSRVLSAFLNKMVKPDRIDKWGYYSLDAEGFNKFLRWLSEGALRYDPHWNLQKKLFLLPLNKYDKVIKFEEYPQKFVLALEERGVNIPQKGLDLLETVNVGTRTRAKSRMEDFYSEENRKLVKALYQQDFDFLGYES
jgi:hypothetical protein